MRDLIAFGFVFFVALSGCKRSATQTEPARASSPSASRPGAGSDEAEAVHRDPTESVHVRLNGQLAPDWTPAQIARVPPARIVTKKGDTREGWWLEELATKIQGPSAHVVAVWAGAKRVSVEGSKRLLLRVMRDGRYKVMDENQTTIARELDQVDVERR